MWLLPLIFQPPKCRAERSSEKNKKERLKYNLHLAETYHFSHHPCTLPHPTGICCKFGQLCIVLHRLTYSHPSGWQKRAKLVRPQPFWPTSCNSDCVYFLFQQRTKNWNQWKVSNCLVFVAATINTSTLYKRSCQSCKSQNWIQGCAVCTIWGQKMIFAQVSGCPAATFQGR